jgi:hypothetical protein
MLEHFPEKWEPVFRRKCDKSKPIALSDSLEAESAIDASISAGLGE